MGAETQSATVRSRPMHVIQVASERSKGHPPLPSAVTLCIVDVHVKNSVHAQVVLSFAS